jgi:hypothetical protein
VAPVPPSPVSVSQPLDGQLSSSPGLPLRPLPPLPPFCPLPPSPPSCPPQSITRCPLFSTSTSSAKTESFAGAGMPSSPPSPGAPAVPTTPSPVCGGVGGGGSPAAAPCRRRSQVITLVLP